MKTLHIFATVLLMSTALLAQNRSGFVNSGNVTRTGSSVVFPAGTSAAPGVQRTAGSVVYPAGGGPQIGIPSAITNLNVPSTGHFGAAKSAVPHGARTGSFVYAYPVYVGGAGYGGYDNSYGGQPPASPGSDQPNVVVVYPPQQPPVIINQYGSGEGQPVTRVQPQSVYPMPPAAAQSSEPEATHYLIAFKDHSIYSAVAYWVDGDTLHYFTTGSTHNQASVSLVDRELTDRLNRESGLEVKLPPAK